MADDSEDGARRHLEDAGEVRRERHQDRRRPRRLRHRRPRRLDRAQGRRRTDQACRHPRRQRYLARRCGSHDHAGARASPAGSPRPISTSRPRRQQAPKISRPDDRSHVARMLAIADPELDHGPRTDKSATMRMCAVSRDVRPIDELIRFVVAPSGEVIPDSSASCPAAACGFPPPVRLVAEAVRRHHFSKGFKRDVRVAATLADRYRGLLERFAIDALAMAAKAGQVISGFTKVADALERQAEGPVRALIHATRRCRRRNPQIGRHRRAKWREWRQSGRNSHR